MHIYCIAAFIQIIPGALELEQWIGSLLLSTTAISTTKLVEHLLLPDPNLQGACGLWIPKFE